MEQQTEKLVKDEGTKKKILKIWNDENKQIDKIDHKVFYECSECDPKDTSKNISLKLHHNTRNWKCFVCAKGKSSDFLILLLNLKTILFV